MVDIEKGCFHHGKRCGNCGSSDISHDNGYRYICFGCGAKTILEVLK